MKRRTNEQLCALVQTGDAGARSLLVKQNLGFLHKTAGELYRSMNLTQSDLCVDCDDLVQEGSISLLNAAAGFDTKRKMKFLTYAVPTIRNAMTNLIRAELTQFEQKVLHGENILGIQIIRLEEVRSEEEQTQRIEAIAHPLARSPEENYIQKETLAELYQAMGKLSAREQTYLLYRFGFTDNMSHPLIGTALSSHREPGEAHRGTGAGQPVAGAALVVLGGVAAAGRRLDIPLLSSPGRRILPAVQILISSVSAQNPPTLLPPRRVYLPPISPDCRQRRPPLPGVSRKQRYNTRLSCGKSCAKEGSALLGIPPAKGNAVPLWTSCLSVQWLSILFPHDG